MDVPMDGGTHMKSRSRKMMIITVIGMIAMTANGQRDQRADEKGKMTNHIGDIKHEDRTQKEINKLGSRNEKHETCTIEIKIGREAKGEAQMNKEEKQEESSRKGIQYHEPYYPKDLPRRDDRNGLPRREDRRSQSSIEPTGYGVLRASHWVTQEPQWERAAHFQEQRNWDEQKRTERRDEHSKSSNQRTECVRTTKLGTTKLGTMKNEKNNKSTKCKTKNKKREKHTECGRKMENGNQRTERRGRINGEMNKWTKGKNNGKKNKKVKGKKETNGKHRRKDNSAHKVIKNMPRIKKKEKRRERKQKTHRKKNKYTKRKEKQNNGKGRKSKMDGNPKQKKQTKKDTGTTK